VRLQHGISGDTSDLHPLFLYAGDGSTEMGRGAALEDTTPALAQAPGDSGSTVMTLPASTSDRRDYVVHYGLQAGLPAGGGQHIYQVPISNQNYVTVTLDMVLHEPVSTIITMSLDVGADGSDEWSFSGDVSATGGVVLADGLAAAVNTFRSGLVGEEVLVPVRLTTDTEGTYFLSNLRGIPSDDHELSIPGGITLGDPTPTETDVVEVCVEVENSGLGVVPAAMVTFFAGDPEIDGYLIGHSLLIALAGEGGVVQGCVDWDTSGFTGDLTLHAHVDYWDLVAENDEDNNVTTAPVTVLTRPDLHVPTIQLSDPEPVAGETVSVTITLRNDGQTAAGASTLALYDGDPEAGGALVGEGPVGVGGESEATLDLTWTPAEPGLHRLFTVSDRDNAVSEYDEDNNQTAARPVIWPTLPDRDTVTLTREHLTWQTVAAPSPTRLCGATRMAAWFIASTTSCLAPQAHLMPISIISI
jgi:hypothetical protein